MKQLLKKEKEEPFLPKNFCCCLKLPSKTYEAKTLNFQSKDANETAAKEGGRTRTISLANF